MGAEGQKGDSSQYTFQIFDMKTMWTYYQLRLRILISMNNRISRITSNQVKEYNFQISRGVRIKWGKGK